MNIQVNTSNMLILECFSTETRVRMIELLSKQSMNISELAEALKLSSAIITKHIQKLEEAGIVGTQSVSGTRGRRKVCHLIHDTLTLTLKEPASVHVEQNNYHVSIPVGQYSGYSVKPTCGLTSDTGIIGMVDDPRYFTSPDHVKAKHIWFASGYIEYRIPNYLVGKQHVEQISISMEICSEAPGYSENWPSDISYYLNDIFIGNWTCPGDFGSVRGVHTPAWWNMGTQHGLLKTLTVHSEGAFLDGIQLSDVTAVDLGIEVGQDIRLKIACPDTAVHCGGISLFGKHFGNYDQEIEVTVQY
jgi:predicted transcriptional regulator